MTEPRLPVLPRVGFALLTIVLLLVLVVFVLLFLVLEEQRWTFLWPAAGVLFGLTWVRGARRTWLEKHRAPAPDAAAPASAAPDVS